MIWLMGCNFGFEVFEKGRKKKVGQPLAKEREVWSFRHEKTHSSSFPTTHDEDQLDEEADEAHDDEAERGLGRDLGELCFVFCFV